MKVVEVLLAAVFLVLGLRSFVRWFGEGFVPASGGEQLVYALHLTARVGVWFALSAFFAGSAVVEHPETLTWFGVVVIAMAGVQLVTGFLLSRQPGDEVGRSPKMDRHRDDDQPGRGGGA